MSFFCHDSANNYNQFLNDFSQVFLPFSCIKLYSKREKNNPTNAQKNRTPFCSTSELGTSLNNKVGVHYPTNSPWVPAVQQTTTWRLCCVRSVMPMKRDKNSTILGLVKSGWWQLKYFLCSSLFGEDDPQFDDHIFQMGWFNHQLEMGVAGVPPTGSPVPWWKVRDFCGSGSIWKIPSTI